MVPNDSVAHRCLEMCHPSQEHTSKEQQVHLGRKDRLCYLCRSRTARLGYWRLRTGTFSWTFQERR